MNPIAGCRILVAALQLPAILMTATVLCSASADARVVMILNPAGSLTISDIEEHWRRCLVRAQSHYRQAFEQHLRMVAEMDEAQIEPADGAFAIAKARRAMALALDEVVCCQKTLVNLVLNGELPPPGADEKILLDC